MRNPRLIREIIEIVALVLLFLVAVHFTLQSYHVRDAGMQPSLSPNSYVMVNKVAYIFRPPERGDVIVFHFPFNTNQDYIERVIGLPGDTVQIDSTRIWVNGVELKEPYVQTPVNPVAKTWKIPTNKYLVMNDNRLFDNDSRSWDYVPKDFIVGKAVVIYWPSTSWQFINTYTAAYNSIKSGH
ncbi:signal peptidase I [Ktedonosporobacter rubrisoli]|uniref:Signal peptidase I n=1 Tax=Ktedonosporobacter rubrisoli TaxID=2509675 RepID=A0A4P6JUD8_KTERU|nr:signal peptidase I [Ktedonosporobacter rubrisoli]QBD78556.1 signal peptidase I [Ktedonosporobacter rubrisoli]